MSKSPPSDLPKVVHFRVLNAVRNVFSCVYFKSTRVIKLRRKCIELDSVMARAQSRSEGLELQTHLVETWRRSSECARVFVNVIGGSVSVVVNYQQPGGQPALAV